MLDPRVGDDPRVAEARRRWRAAGDRLWPVAMVDGESYRLAAGTVGALVDALRERVGSLEALVEFETAPDLDDLGAPGRAAAAQPDLLAAACAVRADELAAERSRRRRARLVEAARANGDAWAVLDDSPTRVVQMHLATGTALAAIADPYAGDEPYRIAELALDPATGEPLDGAGAGEVAFGSRDEWEREWARRRTAIDGVLDTRASDGSDR